MKRKRVHILGASGSGTTTLGRALAERLRVSHFDSDDYCWIASDPPYQVKVPQEQRQSSLLQDLEGKDSWILSGSLCGWGDVAIPLLDLVIYLWIPKDIRLDRLRRRERERYGDQIMPNGSMYITHQNFMAWAATYDEGDENDRSRQLHEKWLSTLPCKVIRIENDLSVEEKVTLILNDR